MISLITAAVGVVLGALLVLLIFAALGCLDHTQAPGMSSTLRPPMSAGGLQQSREPHALRSEQLKAEAEIDEIHKATRRALNDAAGKSWRNLAD